jgi:hypothetical protein
MICEVQDGFQVRPLESIIEIVDKKNSERAVSAWMEFVYCMALFGFIHKIRNLYLRLDGLV